MTLLYLTLPDSTLVDTTLLDISLLDSTLLDTTRLDTTLLDTTLLDTILLDTTLLDTTLLDTTLLDTTQMLFVYWKFHSQTSFDHQIWKLLHEFHQHIEDSFRLVVIAVFACHHFDPSALFVAKKRIRQ